MTIDSTSPDRKGLLKQAFLKIEELEARYNDSERQRTEPIAIVGMSCRFPAGADDIESFWRLLQTGFDAVGEIPSDRWDVDLYFDSDSNAVGKMYTRHGAFLEQVDQFDPQFFGIAPREASHIDPQQRLLLEVVWEALELSGQAPKNLSGSQTGVFIGMTTSDYANLQTRAGTSDYIDTYFGIGVANSIAAGRISYVLGLNGPCMTIDTACSSSLVAIHLACHSLRAGESQMALAGGVSLILSPDSHMIACKGQMLSPDGRCKTFDKSADGYGRGEGCGILVLKRLSDARKDGDNILSLIRATAINQDGRSGGITAPSGKAQEDVISKALSQAGVNPGDVSYIEAHGTGTVLGDPIEVQALGQVYGPNHSKEMPLYIGSVKTNIGHLEAGAGVASLIKTVLALKHSEIPPHLHYNQPNPYIPWDELPIVVTQESTPWPTYSRRRIAGVSSFGFSGTNAHIIVEGVPEKQSGKVEWDRPLHLFALSAKSSKALNELIDRYLQNFSEHRPDSIGDVCFTANAGRSHFNQRLAVIGETIEDLKKGLQNFRKKKELSSIIHGEASSKQPPPVAFLFTGQGSQTVGMGRILYETQPSFRKTLDQCNELLLPYLDAPLLSILYPEPGSELHARELIRQTDYTQPALFALEFALAKLWESCGVEPSVVLGHSVGEYVAACVAGVFSLEDGLKLIAERSRLMQKLPQQGKMAAVFADETKVTAAIGSFSETISIAAINSPENTVISGLERDLEVVLKNLETEGIKFQTLDVSNAFHSPLMEPMLAEFKKVAGQIRYRKPRIDIISNVTGRLVEGDEISNSAYWCRHVREPVRFMRSIQTLNEQGHRLLLEVGPHPTLLGMSISCMPEQDTVMLPSLRRGYNDWDQLLKTLGRLYVNGVRIDWEGFDQDFPRRRLFLPTYPFQRERYWVDLPTSQRAALPTVPSLHPLLGRRLQSPKIDDLIFETVLDTKYLPYLKDHQLFGNIVIPATAYLEMGQAAAKEIFGESQYRIEDFNIYEPLIVKENEHPTVQIIVSTSGNNESGFEIYSLGEEKAPGRQTWKLHANGKIHLDAIHKRKSDTEKQPASWKQLEAGCNEALSSEWYYRMLNEYGVDYGPAFQCLGKIRRGDSEAVGQICIPEVLGGDIDIYHVHPSLLDACLQLTGIALSGDGQSEIRGDVYMPIGVKSYRVYNPVRETVWCHVTISRGSIEEGETFISDIRLFDKDGPMLAEIAGLHFKRADRDALQRARRDDITDWFYNMNWQDIEPIGPDNSSFHSSGFWLIFADQEGLGTGLAKLLKEHGEESHLIFSGERFNDQSSESTTINPESFEDFNRLLRKVTTSGVSPFRGIIYLWNTNAESPDQDLLPLEEFQGPGCLSLLNLIQALANVTWTERPHLTVVTSGAMSAGTKSGVNIGQSPIWGLGRVIDAEYPELQSKLIDLDPSSSGEDNLRSLLDEVVTNNRSENQIAIRQGRRLGLRLVRSRAASHQNVRKLKNHGDRPYQLEIAHRGVLDNLELKPAVAKQPEAGEVQICVDVTGLNFRDVLNALDMYPGDPGPLGNECIGQISALGEGVHGLEIGDQVLALAPQAFCSYVNVKAELVVHKPDEMSIEEAATIPITFLTAHYALHHLAGIKTGDKVLIHAAAGGVGMAALQLAQRAGAEIYATAGAPEKRALLKSLGVQHVMNSRTLDFSDEVMKATDGRGVDIVLNALAGDFIPKSLSVLGKGGRFLELGKTDLWDEEKVAQVNPDISYDVIFLGDVCLKTPELVQSMFRELIQGFREGTLKPLPFQVFSIDDVESAFRFMAQAKHIGKIVVDQRQADEEVFIRAEATYLITGGLGGLGLQFARWMVERGARHIILLARKPAGEETQKTIVQLEADGAKIIVAQADVAERADLQNVLSSIDPEFPLRGIIHAAGVVDDATLVNQNRERFVSVFRPKVNGSWLLHSLTEDIDLDFFAMFSAGAALFGSPGQGNYAAANAFMDGLAYYRQAAGLPALSINWGPWSTIGMAAALNDRERKRWASMGMGMIEPQQGVLALELALRQNASQLAVLPIDWSIYLRQFAEGEAPIFLSEIARDVYCLAEAGPSSGEANELQRLLQEADPDDRNDLLLNHVREQIINALGLKPSMELKLDQGLTDLGMDSLMAVEISNRLKRSLGCSLPSTIAFEYPTLEALTDYLAMEVLEIKLSGDRREEIDNETAALLQAKKEVENISEEEVEKTLIKELEDTGY